MEIKRVTVGELRVQMLEQLAALKDDDEVTFGGGQLTFSRVKNRSPLTGPQTVDIEFVETFTVHPA